MQQEQDHFGVVIVLGIVFFVAVQAALMFLLPNYSRYQKRADAQNDILVTELNSKITEQKIQVEKQKAAIRVQEAKGIADSQAIINSSLTGNYMQYLAIQAQEKMAGSPNHTQIYVPSGQNGIPLVFGADGNSSSNK